VPRKEKPSVNVLHDVVYRVHGDSNETDEWLLAHVPDADFDAEGFINLHDIEPLLEKLEAAGITVYHWNESGLPLEDEEVNEAEVDDDSPEVEADEDETDEVDEGDEPARVSLYSDATTLREYVATSSRPMTTYRPLFLRGGSARSKSEDS
jgi:hypothetical protein